MPLKKRLTRADILPIEQYVRERREHRRRVSEIKRNRRVEVGPFCAFYFENANTMWHQIHEMLYIERGGEAQITDELAAYNPMIPDGSDLSATMMVEIEEPLRRDAMLHRLGGIEHRTFLMLGGERVAGVADATRENTSPDGKASAVQFLKFPLSVAQKEKFRDPAVPAMLGIDHPAYGHMATISGATRRALADDLE